MSKIKQKEIADWLQVNQPYLSRIVNGNKRPSPMAAAELEEKTGISLRDWLLLDHAKLKIKILRSYEEKHDK